MFFKKKTEKKTYDKSSKKPVIKASICNGEQVAGFKDIAGDDNIQTEIAQTFLALFRDDPALLEKSADQHERKQSSLQAE